MPTVFCMTETQEDYIFCKHCGAPKRASAPFCTSCGGASSSDSDVAKSSAIGQPSQVVENNKQGFLNSIAASGLTETLETGVRHLTEKQEWKCRSCGTTFEGYVLAGEKYFCPRCTEKHREKTRRTANEKRQKAEQDRIRAEYERVHVITFNSQGEYNGWLQRAGPSIEIIDTTASPRRGLLYSGTIHKTTFTVTYKLQKPTPTQPAQPQVAASMPPQQPPTIDIPEQIEKLGKLKEQGLLTEDEFQSKKQELLSRL